MTQQTSAYLTMDESPEGAARHLKCRYFVCPDGRSAREWFPPEWDESLPLDCRYFGAALAEMDKRLFEGGEQAQLHVYMTYNARTLPEYGNHVVALLLSDETGLIPRYARHVLAVFKTHRIRPVLGSRTWWRLDQLHIALWLKLARNYALHLRSRWESVVVPQEWPARLHAKSQVLDVPVGYWRQELVPQKKMAERPFHCFFAGGVNLELPFWRRLIPSPKEIARRKMLSVIREMTSNNASFRFEGGAVEDSGSRPLAESRSYSQRMMDSKICLAPRGTAPDTWRFFEGLRAGCLVVCEHLTDEWFYVGAPVLRITDWSELETAITSYLDNNSALEEARLRSLTWWRDTCGEAAVGRAMAQYLVKAGKDLFNNHP